jgi:hypothetical protein
VTPRTSTPPPRASLTARFGPLTVVLVAVALVAVLASTGRADRTEATTPTSKAGSSDARLPITYAEAKKAGTVDRYEWGAKCDPKTGRVTVPSVYAPPCEVARPGVDGGATSPGVTASTITVVLYEPADDDLAATLQNTLDPADVRRDASAKLLALYQDRFTMWGRTIKIVDLKGSGSDETSARADAVKVASEIGAFASIGGPSQQGAYAEELASRKVLCVGCGLSVPDSVFQKDAPYLWGNLQTPEQFLLNVGDYLIDRLNNKKASYAGDPAMRKRTRVFGSINFEQDPPVFGAVSKEVEKEGAARGYHPAARLTYQLVIPELAEKARVLIARLKEKKVTTVIFLGDPLMPIYLTKAATDQDYFPEWIITGTVLTDTTTFGRQYDQRQWAHAFGLSSLPARVPPKEADAWRLYRWYYGTDPKATKTINVLDPAIRLFMTGVHMAGPDLTPETFRDGLFAYPPSGGSPVYPQVSYGDRGYFRSADYTSVDDMGEVWWDANASGYSEQEIEGKGMMRYADGGKRYLPGHMAKDDSHAFRIAGSVTVYPKVPDRWAPPSYPSPAEGGG